MRNGMPALDWMFKTQKEDVQSLLKNLQPSTRALQYMCNHTKVRLEQLRIKRKYFLCVLVILQTYSREEWSEEITFVDISSIQDHKEDIFSQSLALICSGKIETTFQ